MAAQTLVIIPTYNERENLEGIVERVLGVLETAHLLVVDDGSPDGTGEIADFLAERDPRVHTMHRTGKLGLGTAYVQGFEWGIAHGFDILVEMDADGSHPAGRLPALVAAVDGTSASLAIGSRYVPGGRTVDWPRSREVLSRGGNLYVRLALGIDVRDATAGFRAYRSEVLQQMRLDEIDSKGYCFQVDMTLRVLDAGHEVVEVPIEFRERERGTSKMSRAIVAEAMAKVTVWGTARRTRQLGRLVARPRAAAGR